MPPPHGTFKQSATVKVIGKNQSMDFDGDAE
jgi:hypothetical protein